MNRYLFRRGIAPRLALIGFACVGQLCLSQAGLANSPLPPPASAAPQTANATGLTLEQAVRLALENQPQLARLAARVHEAGEMATAEGELPDPKLTVGLNSLPVDTFSFTQEEMTQAMIGISQMIPGGNKRRLASQRMRVEAGRMSAELEMARRRIARDAALAWLNLYYPSQALLLLERLGQEYERELDWSAVALASGEMSQADTLAVRVMRAYVQDQVADMRREASRAQAELARWVRPTAGELRAEGPLPQKPATTGALDEHPELATLRAGVAVAQADAALAREAYKPDWGVDVGYGLRGGGRTDMISVAVGVELPLFTARRQDRRLAARLAAVDGAENELEDRRRELAAGLAGAQADWQAAEQRVRLFEETLIPLAQRRIDSTLALYRGGKGAFSMVLEARRAELEARMQLLRQQVEQARAAVALRYFLNDGPAVPAAER